MRTTEVTCPAGVIVGMLDDSTEVAVRHFHSIPYSRITAPFNDARPAERGMLIDATTAHPEKTALSISTPAAAGSSTDLPVMVWIHGGRFENGSHADDDTGADIFASHGVIQVRIGYRKTLAGLVQFPDDKPAHFRAAHDCQLALEWIQHNIEAFGGDPTNITLVGQSAGANLVLWLCRRDHFRGAFRRAVAMSPAFPRRTYWQRRASLRASLSMPLTRDALNAAKPSVLERRYRRFRAKHITDMALGPAPLEPAELSEVDLIVSSTHDEFAHFGAVADRAGMGAGLVRALGRSLDVEKSQMSAYCSACEQIDPGRPAGRLFSDSLVRRFVDQVAEQAPGRLWEAELVTGTGVPAAHSAELPALFGQDPYAADSGLNAWMLRYCHEGTPGWPQYRPDRTVLRTDFSYQKTQLLTDPLGYLRDAFVLRP